MADEHPLAACYKALRVRLTDGDRPWGNRVFADMAIAGGSETLALPYLVYALATGGAVNAMPGYEHEYVIDVLAVSSTATTGFRLAQYIANLIDDTGSQDVRAAPLESGPDWQITTVSREADVHIEALHKSTVYYVTGASYRFTLIPRG